MFYDGEGRCCARECACGIRQKRIRESKLSFANIPDGMTNLKLSDFNVSIYNASESRSKAEMALKCINYWLDNFDGFKRQGTGLYMYSKAKGSGKTRMAVIIANELMHERKCQVKFCTSLQILNEIKATWDSQGLGGESKLLNDLSKTEILVIDDFGTEQSDKPWINERFYQIINSRYMDRKATIFTSNDGLEQLRYEDRITNRIKERTFQIPFPEESVRDLIARNNMRNLAMNIKNR